MIEWKVKPGDRVRRGDIIGEVETEKGDIDVEVFQDGVVEQIFIEPGEKVPVGTVLATIREEGEVPVVADKHPADGRPKEEVAQVAPARDREPSRNGEEEVRVRASPLARRVAEALGVDLKTVKGTGPGGAIQRADVEEAAEKAEEVPAKPEAPPPEQPEEAPSEIQPSPSERPPEGRPEGAPERAPEPARQLEGMRRAIAAAMSRANREIPHYYLETRIDMSRALSWLEEENKTRPIKERLMPVVLQLKAVAKALADVPELNAYWSDDQHQIQEAVHVGFAISLRQGGLVIPALHHADTKSLDELMADLTDVITRAREGHLRSSELTDGTITVTNLGDLGVETVFGVIYPPQVALVGFGKITEQPWAEDGMLGVRPVLSATLAVDHRATDGRRGGQFLDALRRYLESPEDL